MQPRPLEAVTAMVWDYNEAQREISLTNLMYFGFQTTKQTERFLRMPELVRIVSKYITYYVLIRFNFKKSNVKILVRRKPGRRKY
jgi:hypothetical protein